MTNIKKIRLKEENEFNDLINRTMIKCMRDADKIGEKVFGKDEFYSIELCPVVGVALFKERMKHEKFN